MRVTRPYDLFCTFRLMALQFIGDITQPLHVEAFQVGGNAITVTCNGSSTNLHAVKSLSSPHKGYS